MKKLKWIILGLVTLFMGCDDNNDSNYENLRFSVTDMISLLGEDYDDVLAKYPDAIIRNDFLFLKRIYSRTNTPYLLNILFDGTKVDEVILHQQKKGEVLFDDFLTFTEETNDIASLSWEIRVSLKPQGGEIEVIKFTTYENFLQYVESDSNMSNIYNIVIEWNYGDENPIPIFNFYSISFDEEDHLLSEETFHIGKHYFI